MPVSGSYAVALSWKSWPKRSSIDSGSTPEAASRTRATIVGRPDEMRRVISSMFGGLTSFTQERSR